MTTGAVHAATSSTRISWSGQRATRPTQHPRVEFVSEKCAPVNKLCNVAQSARSRRETYIGPWLPEPVDTSSAPLGSSTGRGAGVRGLVTTRETLSYGTSSVCFPESVRLAPGSRATRKLLGIGHGGPDVLLYRPMRKG